VPTVDLAQIRERLYADPQVVAKLAADYGLSQPPGDPNELATALTDAFGQQPDTTRVKRTVTNREVFRAAVWALASNSRSWSTFIQYEPTLAELLGDYDPKATHGAITDGRLNLTDVKACLPGQTATADAVAILRWADLLHEVPSYYAGVEQLRESFISAGVEHHELLPIVAAFLGGPPHRIRLNSLAPPARLVSWKLPGMGAVLGSEFLRNLRWNGFKPDRHIKRLFGRWFPDVVTTCEPRARQLAAIIGKKGKELVEFLTFSLVGVSVTPADHTFTEVDNLVWALGAYVEKKGKESDTLYRLG